MSYSKKDLISTKDLSRDDIFQILNLAKDYKNLNKYLHNIDTTVMEKVQKLITELAQKENINEQLKENNQMLWVSKMNNIKNTAEEIILKEYIYV